MQLRITTIFLLTAITLARGIKHCKNILKFNEKFYEKEYLADGTVSKPFYMTFLNDSNKILFNADSEPFGNTDTVILDLDSKELTEINADHGIVNGVDENGAIYIGQNGGLFTFNLDTKVLAETALKNIVFYSMLIKGNKIFFTDFPKRDVYVFENNEAKLFIEGLHVNDLTFDKKDNMYFFNKTGVYMRMAADDEIVNIDAIEYDEVPLVSLIYDPKRDLVYATSVYGIFMIDVDEKKLKRVALKFMLDIIFDNDGNMIYSDEESIVRLKPTDATC